MIREEERQIWIAPSSFWLAPFPVASSVLLGGKTPVAPSLPPDDATFWRFLPEKTKTERVELLFMNSLFLWRRRRCHKSRFVPQLPKKRARRHCSGGTFQVAVQHARCDGRKEYRHIEKGEG